MAIFGQSKKSKETTSQRRRELKSSSQPQLPSQYIQNDQSNPYNRPQGASSSQSYNSASSMHSSNYYQPVHITQNFLIAPPLPPRLNQSISRLNLGSVSNLLSGNVSDYIPGGQRCNIPVPSGTQLLNQSAALCDVLSSTFDDIVALLDGDRFPGNGNDTTNALPPYSNQNQNPDTSRALVAYGQPNGRTNYQQGSPVVVGNTLATKVNLYANSRLPPNLKPMKLYMPTFPLLCLAARYSEGVYQKPSGQEREAHIDADWRLGTKAMVIKSVPMDEMNTIVLAIRGTKGSMDWAVNLRTAPASPDGLLDDTGNLCHAGFLTVARKMIGPIAARLRQLLQEHSGRAKYSLLITGHSAGGAVAALLYSHMLSSNPQTKTELRELSSRFKRIHCVTFGAPPVSLLPLSKPSNPALRKSLFMSFINEGDFITRADKAYVVSLADLYLRPAPVQSCLSSSSSSAIKPKKSTHALAYGTAYSINALAAPSIQQTYLAPEWPVPQATLSNAGRLILLRGVNREGVRFESTKRERMEEGVVAQMVSDDELRGVLWGDLGAHSIDLYVRRIEILATNAVMGRS